MYYDKMQKRHEKLEKKIQQLQKKVETYPKERIIHTANGKYDKWFQTDGKNIRYINKNNKEVIEQLVIKKYLTTLLEETIAEKKAIDAYLKHSNSYQNKSDKLLEKNSPYLPYLQQHFTSYPEKFRQWMQSPYNTKTDYKEDLIHKAVTGQMVRSKSEALIIMYLCEYQIPFRYECELIINGTKYYPDFTILHPRTGNIIYWEHFGKMDDLEYIDKTYRKLTTFNNNQILQSINLITTFETKSHPLNSQTIEQTIQQFFL